MVLNTSELLPEPETPVNTVSRRFGISMLTSLRLFTRAPCTRIRSWLSAAWSADDPVFVVVVIPGGKRRPMVVPKSWGHIDPVRSLAHQAAEQRRSRLREERALLFDHGLAGGQLAMTTPPREPHG